MASSAKLQTLLLVSTTLLHTNLAKRHSAWPSSPQRLCQLAINHEQNIQFNIPKPRRTSHAPQQALARNQHGHHKPPNHHSSRSTMSPVSHSPSTSTFTTLSQDSLAEDAYLDEPFGSLHLVDTLELQGVKCPRLRREGGNAQHHQGFRQRLIQKLRAVLRRL